MDEEFYLLLDKGFEVEAVPNRSNPVTSDDTHEESMDFDCTGELPASAVHVAVCGPAQ